MKVLLGFLATFFSGMALALDEIPEGGVVPRECHSEANRIFLADKVRTVYTPEKDGLGVLKIYLPKTVGYLHFDEIMISVGVQSDIDLIIPIATNREVGEVVAALHATGEKLRAINLIAVFDFENVVSECRLNYEVKVEI